MANPQLEISVQINCMGLVGLHRFSEHSLLSLKTLLAKFVFSSEDLIVSCSTSVENNKYVVLGLICEFSCEGGPLLWKKIDRSSAQSHQNFFQYSVVS